MSTPDHEQKCVWYFAYGSNMRSSVMKKRGICLLGSKRVIIRSHVLTFDVFGVPYSEPAMASIAVRSSKQGTDNSGPPPVHGIAYAVSASDFRKLVTSEGAGMGYCEIELEAESLDSENEVSNIGLTVRTLVARYPFRPNALPSARYLNLLIDGAGEYDLPTSYQLYLKKLPSYTRTGSSALEDLGARLFIGFWMPFLSWTMTKIKASADESGQVHEFFGHAVWMSNMSSVHHRAQALLTEVPLIDGHNDFAYMIRGWFMNQTSGADFDIDSMPIGQTDITQLKRGKLGGQFWSAFVPCPREGEDPLHSLLAMMQQIDLLHRIFDRFPHVFALVDRADDIIPAFRSGRVASLVGIEGLHSIGQSASVLRMAHKLGVRYATLCHNKGNDFADSATSIAVIGGLSSSGAAIVREMNRIGMMIDLSHTSHETQVDALAASKAPVIFSHSSCYALCPNPRNVRDETLTLLKENNGIIMICFIPSLVSPHSKNNNNPPAVATVSSVVDHIIHVGTTIGYSHVGIGSDFDGMLEGPQGLDDTSCYPALVEELLHRGVGEQEVKMVMGLNVIRVLRDVEVVSKHARDIERWEALCDEIQSPWTAEQRAILVAKGTERKKHINGLLTAGEA
ncbi:membrane dipeptidase-domain-containing protein [Jackrogersella minutella]|nr:membrane dipeptidase-domain-containing protein [Jackrogersella minutella]